MPTEEQVTGAAETFRMLSDPPGVRVSSGLLQGETFGACLVEFASAAPAVVNRHLAKLRPALFGADTIDHTAVQSG